jgi:hypothetical protein
MTSKKIFAEDLSIRRYKLNLYPWFYTIRYVRGSRLMGRRKAKTGLCASSRSLIKVNTLFIRSIMYAARYSLSTLRRNVPRIASPAFQQQVVLMTTSRWSPLDGQRRSTPTNAFSGLYVPSPHYFSTSAATAEIRGTVSDGRATHHETKQKSPGHVTRTLRVLDMDVVRKILEELKSVDVNADGR